MHNSVTKWFIRNPSSRLGAPCRERRELKEENAFILKDRDQTKSEKGLVLRKNVVFLFEPTCAVSTEKYKRWYRIYVYMNIQHHLLVSKAHFTVLIQASRATNNSSHRTHWEVDLKTTIIHFITMNTHTYINKYKQKYPLKKKTLEVCKFYNQISHY